MDAPRQLECPRCRMRRSLTLQLIAAGAPTCPRCWGKDGVEVPMASYPPGAGRFAARSAETEPSRVGETT